MSTILFITDLNEPEDELLALQLIELAGRLRNCGRSVTLATAQQQNHFNHHWEALSKQGVLWIQPLKKWGLVDVLTRSPFWIQTPYEILHFFIGAQTTSKSLGAYVWISQLLRQVRRTSTVLTIGGPIEFKPTTKLRSLIAQSQLVLGYDLETIRKISALQEIPPQQIQFKSPIFDSPRFLNQPEKPEGFQFINEPFYYAPGTWQDWTHLEKLPQMISNCDQLTTKSLVLGWNWRERKDDICRNFLDFKLAEKFYLPLVTDLKSHLLLAKKCDGFLLPENHLPSLLFNDCIRIATTEKKEVILINPAAFQTNQLRLSKEIRPLPLTEDPVNFFIRCYQNAAQIGSY